MEVVAFGGWNRNVRIVSGQAEIIVTLEVGPRILFYGFSGHANQFVVYDKDSGRTGDDTFHSYGGHRLWIAPEEQERTLQPDNVPVEVRQEGETTIFTAPVDKYHVQREIRVTPRPENDAFHLEHRVYNHSPYGLELAPWAISVMAPGGECAFPREPFITHVDKVLPARPLVLWNYTEMSDPRYTWGTHVTRLRHDMARSSTKIGALVTAGYAAYSNDGTVFLKRFPYLEHVDYPDFGVNFETYTRQDMLEVESVGPMQIVAPGDFAVHEEAWYLLRNASFPADDADCFAYLASIAEARPL